MLRIKRKIKKNKEKRNNGGEDCIIENTAKRAKK